MQPVFFMFPFLFARLFSVSLVRFFFLHAKHPSDSVLDLAMMLNDQRLNGDISECLLNQFWSYRHTYTFEATLVRTSYRCNYIQTQVIIFTIHYPYANLNRNL